MGLILTDSQNYSDIASAIRTKKGIATTYMPNQMASAISSIPSVDTSSDTVTAGVLRSGYTAHNSAGNQITGTMPTIGSNGLTWNEVTSNTWGVVTRIPSDPTLQEKSVIPLDTAQIITPDSGYDGLSQVTVGAIPASSTKILSKTVTYSSAISASKLIWSLSELDGLPFNNLADYEFLSISMAKTDILHSTYQTIYCNSFYPYASYRPTSGYVYAGINWYHTQSTTSVTSGKSATALTGSCNGFFQIKSDGVYYCATTSYQLYGTYLFTIAAKLND